MAMALAVPVTALAATTTTTTKAPTTTTTTKAPATTTTTANTIPATDPLNLVVIPFVDCLTANSDGSTTATYGYYSFAERSTTIAKGTSNNIIPSNLDGPETTTFQPGYVQRAFTVKIAKATTATWTVAGFPASAPNAGSPNCATGGNLAVVGFVSCTTLNKDLSTTALYGYYNSLSSSITIPRGPNNNITPASFDGPEPTTFKSGLQPGIFPLTIPKGATATWTVSGFPAAAPNTWSPACPPSVSLPQEGNGLGLVVGLLLAGVGGTLMIRRMVAGSGQAA